MKALETLLSLYWRQVVLKYIERLMLYKLFAIKHIILTLQDNRNIITDIAIVITVLTIIIIVTKNIEPVEGY